MTTIKHSTCINQVVPLKGGFYYPQMRIQAEKLRNLLQTPDSRLKSIFMLTLGTLQTLYQ